MPPFDSPVAVALRSWRRRALVADHGRYVVRGQARARHAHHHPPGARSAPKAGVAIPQRNDPRGSGMTESEIETMRTAPVRATGPRRLGRAAAHRDPEKEMYGGEAQTTNNRMELTAVIEGLRS
jgi:hypothetical protein